MWTSLYVDSYKENMTDAMLDVVQNFKNDLHDLDTLIARATAARLAGNFSLPALTERGTPVVHGARVRMDGIANAYQEAINAFAKLLDQPVK